MGPIDFLNHLVNLILPALGTAALSAALAKLLWRKELAGRAWWQLAAAGAAAGAIVIALGLLAFGRDGRMATYAALVLANALALWWWGFLRR
jgi:hypothetical protein